jgi:glutathione synthase
LLTARDRRDVIAQAWVDAVEQGNRRIVVFDGEVVGAVNRVPMRGDFRTGPPTVGLTASATDRRIASRLAPMMRRDGLLLAGLDVAGDRLLEVNVTSPGGLAHIEQLCGVAVCDRVVARLQQLLPQVIRLKERVNG